MAHKLDLVTSTITRLIFDAELKDDQKLDALLALTEEVYEDGYDQAATDITLKIQSCIPDSAKNVPDARVQGAWRDAAKIALNHVGKLSRKQEQ